MAPLRRPKLQPGLDKDVLLIMEKLEEANDGKPFKTILAVYDAIKRSNSSLSRQKKRPLEDSIDRVLQLRKKQLAEPDSEAELDQPTPANPDDDRFLLNRQMAKSWHQDQPTSQTSSSQSAERRTTKKRRLRGESEERAAEGGAATPAPALTPEQSTNQVETDVAPAEKPEKTPLKKSFKLCRHQLESFSKPIRLGGVDDVYKDLFEKTHMAMKDPEIYIRSSWRMVPGIVVSGPSGTGKKSLIRSLAYNLEVPLISLSSCFLDAERMERNLNDAIEDAMKTAPCIIYIENIDWYMSAPGSNSHGDSARRAVGIFMQQMKRLQQEQPKERHVLVMATTSKLTDVDPAILKAGLFEETIQMKTPDRAGRKEILQIITKDIALSDDVDFVELSGLTHGCVGADLSLLLRRVCRAALWRTRQEYLATTLSQGGDDDAMDISHEASFDPSFDPTPPDLIIPLKMEDFKLAIKDFVPSLRSEGFTSIPNITWDQVGALQEAREQLETSIIGPIKDPELYRSIGITRPAGCLLWGPPGCGKTLVAQAVANEAKASFILINGPELLNKYVGESERAVRELFNRARSSKPCILFFDEIDSVVPRRDGASNEVGARVVNALLTELDGAQDRSGIYVIGTTNRPDMIDQAMLRPGRLSISLFFDLPTAHERTDILRAIYRTNHPDCKEEDLSQLETVAKDPRCNNFSGADLDALRIKAAERALKRYLRKEKQVLEIDNEDWEHALGTTRASVKNPEEYRKLQKKLERSS